MEYSVLRIDLEAALDRARYVVGAGKLVILQNPDDAAVLRLDDEAADPIPAMPTLELCAAAAELIGEIFVSTPGTGAAGDELVILSVTRGNAALYTGE